MKVYVEPDEGTLFIYIDDLTNDMILQINNIINKNQDNLEILYDDNEGYKYFIDASIQSHEDVIKYLKINKYLITGFN